MNNAEWLEAVGNLRMIHDVLSEDVTLDGVVTEDPEVADKQIWIPVKCGELHVLGVLRHKAKNERVLKELKKGDKVQITGSFGSTFYNRFEDIDLQRPFGAFIFLGGLGVLCEEDEKPDLRIVGEPEPAG